MAHSKPNALSYLVKGKLLSAVRGIVATLNWVIDFCGNFKVNDGSFLSFTGAKDGKPVLDVDKAKFKKAVIEQLKNSEFINEIASQVLQNIVIQGGPNTNLSVTRSGNTFTIDLYWK